VRDCWQSAGLISICYLNITELSNLLQTQLDATDC